ncbi:MAG: hypothetical protein HQ592_07295 [Planctomycetes bacterium]|nr:hypothetical protein [Planctomycetota bacterium]
MCRQKNKWSSEALQFVAVVLLGIAAAVVPLRAAKGEAEPVKKPEFPLEATIVATEAIKDLTKNDIPEWVKVFLDRAVSDFQEQILEDTLAHATVDQSMPLLEGCYTELGRGELAKKLREILKSFNPEEEPEKWFSLEWLKDHAGKKCAKRIDGALKENRARHFERIFKAARAGAVQEQKAKVAQNVDPQPEEVERLHRNRWDEKARLEIRDGLVNRMSKVPMLEEVKQEAEQIADARIRRAREQMQAQLEVVRKATPPKDDISRDQLTQTLKRAVDDAVAEERRKKPDERVYDRFESVQDEINARAKELEEERFRNFAGAWEVTVIQSDLSEMISGSLTEHKHLDRSVKLASNSHVRIVGRECIANYAGKLAEGTERDEFAASLENYADNDGPCRNALEENVTQKVKEALPKVRQKIAEVQIKKYFPKIASREWKADESFIKKENKDKPHGLTDLAKTLNISACLRPPFVRTAEKSFGRQDLLEETERQLVQECGKLLEEAQAAWDGQLWLVENGKDALIKDISADSENGALKTAEEYEKYFVERTNNRWKARHDKKYVDLFGNTKQRIKEIVSAKFKAAEDLIAKEKKAQAEREAQEAAAREAIEKARRLRLELESGEDREAAAPEANEAILRHQREREKEEELQKAEQEKRLRAKQIADAMATESEGETKTSPEEDGREAPGEDDGMAKQEAGTDVAVLDEQGNVSTQKEETGEDDAGTAPGEMAGGLDESVPEQAPAEVPPISPDPAPEEPEEQETEELDDSEDALEESETGAGLDLITDPTSEKGTGAGWWTGRGGMLLPVVLGVSLAYLIIMIIGFIAMSLLSRYRKSNQWKMVITRHVEDLDEAVRFYKGFEGAKVTSRSDDGVMIRIGDSCIELKKSDGDERRESISLSVATKKQDKAKKYIEAKGLPGLTRDQLLDPEGMPIQVRSNQGLLKLFENES